MWEAIKSTVRDDETPWCAAFTGAALEMSGIRSTRSAAARSYLKWGTEIKEPCVGCVVIFWRGKRSGWSGHVGFVVARTQDGRIVVISGNKGDRVSVDAYVYDKNDPECRILGFRMPPNLFTARGNFLSLPIVTLSDAKATGERNEET